MKPIKERNIFRIGNSWGITIPARYIKDGYIDPNKTYSITLEEEQTPQRQNIKKSSEATSPGDDGPLKWFGYRSNMLSQNVNNLSGFLGKV